MGAYSEIGKICVKMKYFSHDETSYMADIQRRGRDVFVFQISDRHIHPPSSTMLKPRLEVVETQLHGDVPLIKVRFF